uniref:Thyrotropin subunit beta n=1 Tax=Pongo abelii TaxID=9601 RepID=A0A2J8ULP7_PONAB
MGLGLKERSGLLFYSCVKKMTGEKVNLDQKHKFNMPGFFQRMTAVFLMSMLFGLACGQAMSFCIPTEYTMHIERRECAYCLTINTTICAGYCMTRDINGKLFLPKYALSQDVCTYRDFIYRTVEIPGCPLHVAPYFSYPVALSCKCGKCNTDYSDCIHEAIKTNYCTKPQKSYLVGFSV